MTSRHTSMVSATRWDYKVFQWCTQGWIDFLDVDNDNYWRRNQTRTNLCFYIRVIILWTPLRLLFHIATLAILGFVFFWYPSITWGLGNFWTFWGVIAACVAFLASLVWALSKISGPVGDFATGASYALGRGLSHGLDYTWEHWLFPAAKQTGNFFDSLLDWIVAMKHKTCPLIEFVDKEGEIIT